MSNEMNHHEGALRRQGLLTAVFAVSLCAVAWGQMPAAKVVTTAAESKEIPATITLVATVEPVRRSRVASEMAGLVEEMPVRQGDHVNAGDVLCGLNDDTLSSVLAEASARLEALKAYHEELVTGTRPEVLDRLKAMVDEAEAEVARWDAEMTRVSALYSEADSNEKEVYDTRADYAVAKHRKQAADAAYREAVAGPRAEVIAKARHDVAEQQAVVNRAQTDLDKATIRAPFGGYVVARGVEIGEWVPVGGTVVEIVDLGRVLVTVDAPESGLPHMKVGDPARVEVDALGRAFRGTIRHIIRQADPTARTFPVEIEVDNADGHLAAGMFARATVPSGAAAETVAVPKDAIVERNGVAYVAPIMPGSQGEPTAMLMPVTVGAEIGEWVAITSGNVQAGTQVITRGTERIMPFPMAVELVNPDGTPAAAATNKAPSSGQSEGT